MSPSLKVVKGNSVLPSTIPEFTQLVEDVIDRRLSDGSEKNMSEPTITKDWVEKRIQDVDHKREIDRKEWQSEVKDMNHKFNMVISESNAKFEKLFAETKSESEKNILRIEASISKAQIQIIIWIIGTLIALTFGALRYLSPTPNFSEEKSKPIVNNERQEKQEITNHGAPIKQEKNQTEQ